MLRETTPSSMADFQFTYNTWQLHWGEFSVAQWLFYWLLVKEVYWFESCQDLIYLPCIYKFVSLLQTFFFNNHCCTNVDFPYPEEKTLVSLNQIQTTQNGKSSLESTLFFSRQQYLRLGLKRFTDNKFSVTQTYLWIVYGFILYCRKTQRRPISQTLQLAKFYNRMETQKMLKLS